MSVVVPLRPRDTCDVCGATLERPAHTLDESVGGKRQSLRWCGQCDAGKERKRVAAISRAVEKANIPPAFVACEDAGEVLARMHGDASALARLERWLAHRGDLTLFGCTGAGKTSAACHAAFRSIELGHDDVFFCSVFDLGIARRNSPLGAEAELVEKTIRVATLILDDVGSEPTSQVDAIAFVVSKRHEQCSETIITSWMNREELGARYGFGIARRVLERATVVRLQGPK